MKVIEVKNLVKEFNGRKVLDGISFEVEEGEVFGYLGPNGAGKTTTLRIILGLLNPTSGKAIVMGKNLAEDDEARKKIGVVLENDGLYEDLSAFDNLEYYAQLYDVSNRKEKIEDLLRFVGLYERRREKVGVFSKGMRRKLAIARAIIHDPEILFLDEPSAGLDPEAQRMVRNLIVELSRKGRTIFLNSHDLDEVQRICDRIAILQRGRLMVCDAVENLRKKFSKPVTAISTTDEKSAKRALEILNSLGISDCNINGKIITFVFREDKQSHLLRILTESGIEIEEIRKVTKTLEDIYLEIIRRRK